MKGIYYPIAQHLQKFCKPGQHVIWRDSFRWKHHNPLNMLGTIVGDIQEFVCEYDGKTHLGQATDEIENGNNIMALKGQLRPKNPPRGEKSISEMFSKPYVKELDKEKELEEACEQV